MSAGFARDASKLPKREEAKRLLKIYIDSRSSWKTKPNIDDSLLHKLFEMMCIFVISNSFWLLSVIDSSSCVEERAHLFDWAIEKIEFLNSIELMKASQNKDSLF